MSGLEKFQRIWYLYNGLSLRTLMKQVMLPGIRAIMLTKTKKAKTCWQIIMFVNMLSSNLRLFFIPNLKQGFFCSDKIMIMGYCFNKLMYGHKLLRFDC